MLLQVNKIKNILSKLIVASNCYKKILRIKKTKITKNFLNLLQEKGFIYGYTNCVRTLDYFLVFLKYSEGNDLLLANITFLGKLILQKKINFFEKNSFYLIITKSGLYLGSVIKKKKINGYVIAKF
jgi:ribosomal protein S8